MNSTRPAIVASRSLVRGQPTERQSGRGSLRPGGRSEAEGETGADRRTTRRLPSAYRLPANISGPALIVDLLPIDPDSYNTKRPDPYTLRSFGSMTGIGVPPAQGCLSTAGVIEKNNAYC